MHVSEDEFTYKGNVFGKYSSNVLVFSFDKFLLPFRIRGKKLILSVMGPKNSILIRL